MLNNNESKLLAYQKHVVSTGGNPELFHLPIIQQIIYDIIENGDPILKSLGKSTIYYKDANEDGTFDICGRINSPNVDLAYVMSYCHDDEILDHYLLLKRFEVVKHFEGNYDIKDGISQKDIFLNSNGQIVEEINYPMIEDTNYFDSLLSVIKEKQFIKKIV